MVNQKREMFLELLELLSTKKDWEDITTVRAMFKPDKTQEMIQLLKDNPDITELEFSMLFFAKDEYREQFFKNK